MTSAVMLFVLIAAAVLFGSLMGARTARKGYALEHLTAVVLSDVGVDGEADRSANSIADDAGVRL